MDNLVYLKKLDGELVGAWREQYGAAKSRSLSVTPVIKKKAPQNFSSEKL